jgi:uncharacterized membrane protein
MEFLVILAVFALVSAIIMPWVNHSRINKLQAEIERLKWQSKRSLAVDQTVPPQKKSEIIEEASIAIPHETAQIQEQPVTEKESAVLNAKIEKQKEEKISFEQQFAARMPVWIGGIALALAGFFMVKYSVENNLLSPVVRVTLGAVLGVALIYSARWIRSKPDFANGTRISQSLAGAGIAVLYVVSFASARLYELIPMYAGFLAMASVTATAMVLALRNGAPIALLGMAGGFLTPALLNTGGGNAFSLFVYLYFTASGLMLVVRKTKLWWLSIPTIIASLIWVIVWLCSSYTPVDSLYLGLFLVGIAATIVISSRKQYEEDCGDGHTMVFKITSVLNYIGLGGTLGVMALIGAKAGFGFMEWGLFGLLSLGGIGLAYFNNKLYGFIPLLSMAVNVAMLFAWKTDGYLLFAQVLAVFAAIFVVSGYLFVFRSLKPILWAGLAGTGSIAYYLLAYYKLHGTELFESIPLFWGITAMVLAIAAVYVLFKVYNNMQDYPYRERLYAIFVIVATSFVSLALSIELDREFLSVSIAIQLLAMAWLNTKVSIKSLRPIIAVVACVFVLLLMPQIILMIQVTAYSLVEATLRLQPSVPIVQWPLFQLGVPAVMFLESAKMLRKQNDDKLVRIFEVLAIALVAVMGYYLTRNMMHPDENILFVKAGFFERGIITNVIFLFGLSCLFVGRKFRRNAVICSGVALCISAAFRIIYFDMFSHNPLWDHQQIKGIIILNSLLLPYGLPIIWSYMTMSELKILGKEKLSSYAGAFILALLFVLINMNVRHIFQGEYLNAGVTTNAEIYSYSAASLLLGIALLAGGIIKKDKLLRYASLSVILFTVGKVFLYDASELEGLYRVFSFFGLGLSLIGLSYFYTRFVFNIKSSKG